MFIALPLLAALAAAKCQYREGTCTVINDPWVTPFSGAADKFDYQQKGRHVVLDSDEMKVSVNVIDSFYEDNKGQEVFIVNKVWFKCGTDDELPIDVNTLEWSGFAAYLPCNAGTCQGVECHVKLEIGTLPITNIDITSLVYHGTNGNGGLCYNNDNTCTSSPSTTSTVSAVASTTTKSVVPTSHCKPHKKSCIIQEDPWVRPFQGAWFSIDDERSYIALDTDEMKVKVSVVDSWGFLIVGQVELTCGTDAPQTWTVDSVRSAGGVKVECGKVCKSGDCVLTLGIDNHPVENLDVDILYLGENGNSGFCYKNDNSCPKQKPTTVTPTSATATSTSTAVVVPTGHCQHQKRTCIIREDPWVGPFMGDWFPVDRKGQYTAIDTDEFNVLVTVDSSHGYKIVSEVQYSCGTDAPEKFTVDSVAQAGGIHRSCASCKAGDCVIDISVDNDPVDNLDTHIRYNGYNGNGGLCYKHDQTCPPPKTTTSTSTVTSSATPTPSNHCQYQNGKCSVINDPWVTPFSGSADKFDFQKAGRVSILQSEDMTVYADIVNSGFLDNNMQEVYIVDKVWFGCGHEEVQTYTVESLFWSGGWHRATCDYGSCKGVECSIVVEIGSLPIFNVDMPSIYYRGTKATGGLCYGSSKVCPLQTTSTSTTAVPSSTAASSTSTSTSVSSTSSSIAGSSSTSVGSSTSATASPTTSSAVSSATSTTSASASPTTTSSEASPSSTSSFTSTAGSSSTSTSSASASPTTTSSDASPSSTSSFTSTAGSSSTSTSSASASPTTTSSEASPSSTSSFSSTAGSSSTSTFSSSTASTSSSTVIVGPSSTPSSTITPSSSAVSSTASTSSSVSSAPTQPTSTSTSTVSISSTTPSSTSSSSVSLPAGSPSTSTSSATLSTSTSTSIAGSASSSSATVAPTSPSTVESSSSSSMTISSSSSASGTGAATGASTTATLSYAVTAADPSSSTSLTNPAGNTPATTTSTVPASASATSSASGTGIAESGTATVSATASGSYIAPSATYVIPSAATSTSAPTAVPSASSIYIPASPSVAPVLPSVSVNPTYVVPVPSNGSGSASSSIAPAAITPKPTNLYKSSSQTIVLSSFFLLVALAA